MGSSSSRSSEAITQPLISGGTSSTPAALHRHAWEELEEELDALDVAEMRTLTTIRSVVDVAEVADDEDIPVPERLRYKGKLYLLMDASDSVHMMQDPAYLRASSRMGAIVVTFLIELIVAFQISKYTDTLVAYPLLISLMPVMSAVSCNVGLQSGSITARGIEVGTVTLAGWKTQLWREMSCGTIMATLSAVLFYAVTDILTHNYKFGIVIGFCTWCSVMAAACSGTVAPFIFKYLGTDPIAWAGPLETGVVDVLGNTAFLYITKQLLSSWVYR